MKTRRGFLHRALLLLGTAAGPAGALPDPARPGIARRYLPGSFGQLHVQVATPRGPEAGAPPLVLLHMTALSGRMFSHFLPEIAQDRLVIAVDIPGYGGSDRPGTRPSLSAYGDAILDALSAEFGGAFDLLGYHTGAAIAADLAARRPGVARTVLVSMPFFSRDKRREMRDAITRPGGYRDRYEMDGGHLLEMWEGTLGVRPEGQSLDDVARTVMDKQSAGRFGNWALLALLEHDFEETLAAIAGPVLVVAPHDGLESESRRAAAMIPGARLVEFDDLAYGLFDAQPGRIAATVRPFLARSPSRPATSLDGGP